MKHLPPITPVPSVTDDVKPLCAICGHEVERLIRERDVFTCQFIYTAECHGDREEAIIDDSTIEDATGIRFGLAFNSKKLDSEQKKLP